MSRRPHAADPHRTLRRWAWLALGLSAIVGCQSEREMELARQVADLKTRLAECNHRVAAQQTTIDELNAQVANVRGLTPEDLKHIYYPEEIRLASLTGGVNTDDQPGDDGVNVYLQPVDRDGHVVKVAGDIRVELFDLALAPQQTLLGRYEFPLADARERWYGSLWTQHYTLKCPWRNGPPRHAEITVRAVFTDYLTQRPMTTQTVCTIELPPSADE